MSDMTDDLDFGLVDGDSFEEPDYQPGMWTTAAGVSMHVSAMRRSHLINTIRWLEVRGLTEWDIYPDLVDEKRRRDRALMGTTIMNPESIKLFFREGGSDKVYEAKLIQVIPGVWAVDYAYGRRNSTMTTGTKGSQLSYAAAKKVYDKLVRSKIDKGYRTATPAAPASGSITDMTAFWAGQPPRVDPLSQVDSGLRVQMLNEVAEDRIKGLISSPLWGMQVKMDGRRMVLRKRGDTVTAINRKGLIIAIDGPIVAAVQKIPGNGTLDGEACGSKFFAFDLLEDGGDIRSLPYRDRYHRLDQVLTATGYLQPIELLPLAFTTKDKQKMFDMAKRTKCEGVVFKRLDMPSNPGRPNSGGVALKFKFYTTGSFVVNHLNDRRSVGIKTQDGEGIHRMYQQVGNVTVPPNYPMPKPGDVVEVRYLYVYREGSLYQPVYLGVRDDIERSECTINQLKYKQDEDDA